MKKSKRFWTWTRKQKQRSRNHKHASDNIPDVLFKKMKKESHEMDRKAILDELNGKDGVFSTWQHHKAFVSWMYW